MGGERPDDPAYARDPSPGTADTARADGGGCERGDDPNGDSQDGLLDTDGGDR